MKDQFRPLNSPLESFPKREASHLFERAPDETYIREWTENLRNPSSDDKFDTLSVLVFRLGQEWLALPTMFFRDVTQRRAVHCIPHRTSKILQGIVNLNGKLELYVALHELLQIETVLFSPNRFRYQYDRMLAMGKEGELWVFHVDEIDGIYSWNLSAIENVPVNVSKSSVNYMKGIMKMDKKSVGLLDEELLFSSLARSIQ